MAAYSTRMRPDFTSGRIDTPDVANVLLDFADRQAKHEALGIDRVMQQAKYETELGFKQRAEDRLLKEQAASDQYYKSLLGGPQSVGGALNTQSFINEATKYDLTPEEITFSNANKITTAEQARKLGNDNLAKKFEGQMGLSNLSDRLYSEGALQESRVQRLERALGDVVNQGLPVPKELAAQIDQARLAEQTAQEAKLKANSEELANLNKERKNDLKWLVGNINSGSGTATVLDENGNPVTVSTGKALQKEITASNKSASTGIEDLQTSINKLGLSKEKKLDAIARANELVSALEAKGIPTAEASGIVAKEMTTKENNPYLSYIGFSNMGPDANKEVIASYGDMLVDRYQKLNSVPTTATSLDSNSKYKAAEAFVHGSGAATDAQIAKLTAERRALMMSPEERMVSRIDAAVAGLNPSATTGLPSVDMSKFSEGDFDMNRYLKKTTNIESSGNSKAQNGQHYGLGQFKQSTVEELGLDWNRYKKDPAYQVEATKAYALKNASLLEKNGYPVNDFTVYMAHNQGPGGALKVLDSIKNGTPLDRTTKLNLLNQGIAPTTLPRASNGQLDYSKISDEALSKYSDADVLNAYVGRYGTKMGADVDTDRLNTSYKKLKEASPAAVADKVTTGEEAKKVLEKVPSRTASETSRIAANYAKVADTAAEGDFKDLTPKEIQEVREYMFSPKKSPFSDAYNNYKKDTPFKYDVNEKTQLLDDMLAAEGLSTEEEIRGYMNTLSKPDKLLLERHLKLKNSGAAEADRASRLIREAFEKSSKERTGMDKIINDVIHNNHPINYFGR